MPSVFVNSLPTSDGTIIVLVDAQSVVFVDETDVSYAVEVAPGVELQPCERLEVEPASTQTSLAVLVTLDRTGCSGGGGGGDGGDTTYIIIGAVVGGVCLLCCCIVLAVIVLGVFFAPRYGVLFNARARDHRESVISPNSHRGHARMRNASWGGSAVTRDSNF